MNGRNVTVQFARNFTAEPIGEELKQRARALGLTVETSFGAYDNVVPEILEVSAATPAPAVLVVALDLAFFSGGLYSPHWSFDRARDDLSDLLAAVDGVPKGTRVLLTTFLPPFTTPLPWAPDHPLLGREAAAFPLNEIIRGFVAERPQQAGLLDFERIAARLGEEAALDPRFGLMMKSPFRQPFVEAAAEALLRDVRCQFVAPKKVLVLDCDDTLWGGVVGECGVDGIQLDPYEYPGIAYYRFQHEVLTLVEQGVLVCLCSKNDESAVWEVLDRHPHCLLKRSHLAAHRINWTDKASNLRDLAAHLNLSIDSMVFVDDNPVECELVKSIFPELSVLRVPSKIYTYPGLLRRSGYFDQVSVNPEDKERTKFYQAEHGRREIQKRHVDTGSFLRDLQMKAVVRRLEPGDVSRVAQLCQRTNQFNVTTKRHTEAEIAAMQTNPAVQVYILQASDRFGPVGLSGLAIYRRNGPTVEVDTFLLSCRIIGRQFDRALFCESLRRCATEWDFTHVRAHYVPSPKNNVVHDLWVRYGFRLAAGEPGNGSTYEVPLGELALQPPSVIEISNTL